MTKRFILVMTAVILTAAATTPCRGEGISAPRMVIEEPTFDFQEVDEGSVLEHAFIIKNTGDQPLEIKKVAPG